MIRLGGAPPVALGIPPQSRVTTSECATQAPCPGWGQNLSFACALDKVVNHVL